MFQKVLIAEDLDTINLAINHVVHELAIEEIHHVKYCDDALPKIKRALADGQPFDLMISDLSFKEDGRIVTLTSGEELITAVKNPCFQFFAVLQLERSYITQSLPKRKRLMHTATIGVTIAACVYAAGIFRYGAPVL